MSKALVQQFVVLADDFDRQGKVEEAEAITCILHNAGKGLERKRAIAKVLVQVADSLDRKGAHKEAQMADQLVTELADVDFADSSNTATSVLDAPAASQDVEIKSVPQLEPEYDEVSLEELERVRDSAALRFTQRHDREAYERAIDKARQAKQYKDAYEQWLDAAHKELGDRPLRLKL